MPSRPVSRLADHPTPHTFPADWPVAFCGFRTRSRLLGSPGFSPVFPLENTLRGAISIFFFFIIPQLAPVMERQFTKISRCAIINSDLKLLKHEAAYRGIE